MLFRPRLSLLSILALSMVAGALLLLNLSPRVSLKYHVAYDEKMPNSNETAAAFAQQRCYGWPFFHTVEMKHLTLGITTWTYGEFEPIPGDDLYPGPKGWFVLRGNLALDVAIWIGLAGMTLAGGAWFGRGTPSRNSVRPPETR